MHGALTTLVRRTLGMAGGAMLVAGALVPINHAVAATGSELFISEYVEGSGTNQAIELYNPTDLPISLSASGYRLEFYGNGSPTATGGALLIGVIAPAGTWVIAPTDASSSLLAKANQTFGSSAFWFDGNDAVILIHDGTAVDVVGQVGVDPGSEWGSGLASTRDNTLRRKLTVTAGDPNGSDPFDPSLEWDGFATDAFDGLGLRGEPAVNAPVAITCPGSLSTTQPADVAGAVSAADPDGRVVSLVVTAVTPADPGTFTMTGFSPASAPGGTASGVLHVAGATPAGAYTVTLTAANDDTTPQTATCSVAVSVSPFVSAFEKLSQMVARFVESGAVDASKASLLTKRLDRLAADQEAGRSAAFRAQLRAFGNQVDGLAPRWMSMATAAALNAQLAAVLAEGT